MLEQWQEMLAQQGFALRSDDDEVFDKYLGTRRWSIWESVSPDDQRCKVISLDIAILDEFLAP